MGQIITLNSGMYSYELPPIPKETDVWYHDLKPKDQYWKSPINKNLKWLEPDGSIKKVSRMNEGTGLSI